MNVMVTASRVRSILKDARTEKDAANALRAHRIRYAFSTAGGFLHIHVPIRSGSLRVYRTASRSAPLAIVPSVPAPYAFTRPVWPTWEVDA